MDPKRTELINSVILWIRLSKPKLNPQKNSFLNLRTRLNISHVTETSIAVWNLDARLKPVCFCHPHPLSTVNNYNGSNRMTIRPSKTDFEKNSITWCTMIRFEETTKKVRKKCNLYFIPPTDVCIRLEVCFKIGFDGTIVCNEDFDFDGNSREKKNSWT